MGSTVSDAGHVVPLGPPGVCDDQPETCSAGPADQTLEWWVYRAVVTGKGMSIAVVTGGEGTESTTPYSPSPGATINYVTLEVSYTVEKRLFGDGFPDDPFVKKFVKPGCYKYQYTPEYEGPKTAEQCDTEDTVLYGTVGRRLLWFKGHEDAPYHVVEVSDDGTLAIPTESGEPADIERVQALVDQWK